MELVGVLYGGSPPRARGRYSHRHENPAVRRFTPACAGTVTAPRWTTSRQPVHPRVRGDGHFFAIYLLDHSGSPPRARGRFWDYFEKRGVGRFTPACAGTVRTPAPDRMGSAVHPRVRGDGRMLLA